MPSQTPLSSMTGFARIEGGDEGFSWAWEAKSVNGRSRDIRSRLPQGQEVLEAQVRSKGAEYFARGNIQVNLSIAQSRTRGAVQVNRELLDQLIGLTRGIAAETGLTAPGLDRLIGLPGVLESIEQEPDEELKAARQEGLQQGLTRLFESLAEARRTEGEKLRRVILEHLETLEGLVAQAASTSAAQPEALKARLAEQVAALLEASPALSEERLAQEAALLATKADVREELDRLTAHIAAARELLAAGGAVGRKLDFLCQELNREANTLCSKSSDMALTRLGLDLKSSVEQLREQIQNVE